MHITRCRLCLGKLKLILSLGDVPLVNYFPSKKELPGEMKYPLNFCRCKACGLVQLDYIIDPKKIFQNYHYSSGASKPLIAHLRRLAKYCINNFGLKNGAKVLDIGSNDGTLLLEFKKKSLQILGIEPATAIAHSTKKLGIPVVNDFFSKKLADKIRDEYGLCDLITATHVLANIVDLNDFMRGVGSLLKPDGALVIEVGSLKETLSNGRFDSIYHEHYSYFCLDTLNDLLKQHGFFIWYAKKIEFQGTSLRIIAKKTESKKKILLKESLTNRDYLTFVKKTKAFKELIHKTFHKMEGKIVVGFGAPAKAVTLLNYCNIGTARISYIIDSTPAKQNRFIPGIHIPILEEQSLKKSLVDYGILLAWNYQDFMLKKIKRLVKKNTKIIVPFPKWKVVKV